MSQNTMYVNYMTKTYHNFLKSYEAGQKQAESVSFADKIAEKRLETADSAQPVISATSNWQIAVRLPHAFINGPYCD